MLSTLGIDLFFVVKVNLTPDTTAAKMSNPKGTFHIFSQHLNFLRTKLPEI